MNDSRPPEPDLLLAGGPLDAAFLQFSGAIWYPMVYDYPDNAQQVLGHKKRVAQSARALRYIEVLDPAFVVPSAGPPCFLDPDLFEFNDLHGNEWNTFPDQPTFLDYMAEHGRAGGRLMLPGSVADVAKGRFDVTHPVDPATIFADKRAYLRGVPGAQGAGHRRRAGRLEGRAGRPPARAQDLVGPAARAGRHDLRRHRPAGAPRRRGRADRHRLRDPRGAAAARGRGPALPVRHRPRARRPSRPRACRGLGERAVPVDALPGPAARPVQRLRLHLVQVPERGAAPVRRGLLRRARADARARSSSPATTSSAAVPT